MFLCVLKVAHINAKGMLIGISIQGYSRNMCHRSNLTGFLHNSPNLTETTAQARAFPSQVTNPSVPESTFHLDRAETLTRRGLEHNIWAVRGHFGSLEVWRLVTRAPNWTFDLELLSHGVRQEFGPMRSSVPKSDHRGDDTYLFRT